MPFKILREFARFQEVVPAITLIFAEHKTPPKYLSSDNDPLFRFQWWRQLTGRW